MENTKQKRTRTDHTTPEYRNELKQQKEELRAKLSLRLNKLDKEIEELSNPYVPKPRKPRKASVASVIKGAKDEFSPEELRAILDRAREAKIAMGAE